MSDFKPVNQPITPASADPGEEFPFLHTITVVDRVVSVDNPELVQNNIRTETVTLNLDSEWDGLSCIINIGSGKTPTSLIWSGKPVIIPAELMTDIGTLNVSVVGYGDDGHVRAVTKKADAIFTVVASGYVEGDEPVPDPTTILGQLTEAADRANQAADRFNQASEDIGDISNAVTEVEGYADAAKTSETNAAASATAAQQAVDGLQTTVKEQGSKINQNTNTISQVLQKADSLERGINSFKATVSETYTTKDEFNALEIGGTNLLRNTQAFTGSGDNGGLAGSDFDISGETYNGLSVRSRDNISSMIQAAEYHYGNVEYGESYTFSFWAKGDVNQFRCFFYGNGKYLGVDSTTNSQGHVTANGDGVSTFSAVGSEWTRCWVTWTLNTKEQQQTTDNFVKYVLIRTDGATNGGSLSICGCKLEKGNKPTAWSPAPEDFDGKYTSKTEFKQVLSNYVPLSTYQALETRVQALEAKLANK